MSLTSVPEIRLDAADVRPPAPRSPRLLPALAGAALGLAVIGGWLWWTQQGAAPLASAPAAQKAAAPAATAPQGEIETYLEPPTVKAPPLQPGEIGGALQQLLGPRAAQVQPDDFPRRFVATLDNLGREHAPALMWPVPPTPGRFTVDRRADGSEVIAGANAQRYAAFVELASSVDAAAAVQLYARMYPLLQQSYRHLGFGDRSLNDRAVKVIDQLLAAPEPAQPPAVRLVEVKGPIPSNRPWVRYEFADPALERLSAGQKIMVRVGPANERRLKQKLKELRAELVRPAGAAR